MPRWDMSRRPKGGNGEENGTTARDEELTPLLTGTTEPRTLYSNGVDDNGIPPALRSSDPSVVKSGETYVRAKGWAARRLVGLFSMDQLDIYGLPSLAILMSYFSVGIALELLSTPVAYYLIDDLGASSSVYTVWNILVTLPWSFKVTASILHPVSSTHTSDGVVELVSIEHRLNRLLWTKVALIPLHVRFGRQRT